MGRRGNIQYRLTASYTRQGYYSFIPELIQGLERVWVLKGPIGSGRSTFIKTLGENLAGLGYEVEFWLSAMEPGSAEGVYIPQVNAAVVNGSMPYPIDVHIHDIKGDFINLGEGFHPELIEEQHQDLVFLSARILHHNRLSENLIENMVCMDKSRSDAKSEDIDQEKLEHLVENIEKQLYGTQNMEKHFFACALTIDGMVDYVQEVGRNCQTRYRLQGPPGCGQERVLHHIANNAKNRGFIVEYYHWALDPQQACLIMIPALKTALLDESMLQAMKQPGDVIIDMTTALKLVNNDNLNQEDYHRRLDTLLLQVQVELDEVYKAFRQLKGVQSSAIDPKWVDMQRDRIERELV